MRQFTDSDEEQRLLERHAERKVLKRIRGASFSHSLTLNHLAEQFEVVGTDGRSATVHGKDIVSHTTWERFLAARR